MPIPHLSTGAAAAPDPQIVAKPEDGLSDIIASAFGVPAKALHGASRGPKKVALARQVGMYLAHVHGGLTLAEAGALFGRDRTTAAHACRVIEERRDDATFDFVLSAVEEACGLALDGAERGTTS